METSTSAPRRPALAGAIYGSVLVTALIATLSEDEDSTPESVAVWVLVSVVVFWLAHAYANVLADSVGGTHSTLRRVGGVLAEEWPMVQAAALPVLALMAGAIGLVSDDASEWIALGLGVATLFFWGVRAGLGERLGRSRVLLAGAVSASFGVVIVLLKVAIH